MSGHLLVFEAAARANDSAALARLLKLVPASLEMGPLLREKFFGQVYDRDAKRDYWLGSDGTTVVCVTIAGVTQEDAAKMRLIFEQRTDRTLNAKMAARVASIVTDKPVDLLN
jgi:hypothetical protein